MYSIVDIETTGNGYKGQKITEISIFLFDGQKVIDEFTSLVNPEKKISNYITNLTGITEAMVSNAPKFYEIAKKVVEITKDAIFVAHNVHFDYNVVREEFRSLGFNFSRKKLCTVRLSRKIIPGLSSYSLGNICNSEGIIIAERHRAKGDAEATLELFQKLLEKDKNFTINSFLHTKSREVTLPPLLDKLVIDNLPETYGVYYFKNLQKKVIYVGKANNIKQRVISHFYDKKKKERTMCLETADVTYKETGSEILALLHESSEIKHFYPKFNRAQRRTGEAFGLFSYKDQKGILHLAFDRLKLVPNPILKFYSMMECKKILEKICNQFELCPKFCHLETKANTCFHFQIKKCRGVCSGKETPENYNRRVNKALQPFRLQTENLVLKEKGRTKNEIGIVLILNGIYRGFGFINKDIKVEEPHEYERYIQPKKDNRDIQRILTSYISKK